MIYGYARISTDRQNLAAQTEQLEAAGCAKMFREQASGAKRDRAQLGEPVREIARLFNVDASIISRLRPEVRV